MPRSKSKQAIRNQAFTLIELLVVISIIALLLSIVVPSMRKAKEYARKTVCKSNCRQWGVIYLAYSNDNDGFFPAEVADNTVMPGAGTWFLSLRPYYETPDILLCPASVDPPDGIQTNLASDWYDARFRWKSEWWDFEAFKDEDTVGSYGENWFVTSSEGGSHDKYKFKRTTKVKIPSNTPVLGDCGAFVVRPWETAGPPPQDGHFKYSSKFDEMGRICTNRHKTGDVNWSFADGSVQEIRLKRLWDTPSWHLGWTGRTIMDWSAMGADWMTPLPE